MKKIYIAGIVAVILIIVAGAFYTSRDRIDSFEECAMAGYPILESYPEMCRTPEGKTFTRQVAFNYSEGLILMRNTETNEYACFGCNSRMCIDPAPIMETVEETQELHCDDNFAVVQLTDIVRIKENFGNKIVYDMDQNKDNLVIDCNARGGTFSECGSPCASDAEMCVKMCAFTCEDIK